MVAMAGNKGKQLWSLETSDWFFILLYVKLVMG